MYNRVGPVSDEDNNVFRLIHIGLLLEHLLEGLLALLEVRVLRLGDLRRLGLG